MSARAVPKAQAHRWFAASYDLITWWAERSVFGPLRRLVVGSATGRVLEIGAGTGANFAYYAAAEAVVATEPDPFMFRRASRRAERQGLDIQIQRCPAEALPFADGSFDTVVSTLVLCSVADPDRALAEARRVLKEGGYLRFMEHVRADGLVGQVQDLLTPAWRWFGAGCHLNRHTDESIEAAGFEIVRMRRRALALTPLIFGVARRM